ncbi:MAG TPA: phage portal protein [Desulfosporosinus sp.]|nr:phage portal protein [Desulfosporosinus sp.]
MGLITWIKDRLGGHAVFLSGSDVTGALDEYSGLMADIYFRELAFWSAVNIIANAVSKCEFKTFLNGKETKGNEYYLWNIEPNKNQNSSGFIHKWISQLYRNNECLIIGHNEQLLVADSFIRTPYALFDDVFTGVTVGDFTFKRSFNQSEVLYWQLSSQDMRKVINGLYQSYSKLIAYSMKYYQKSRGTKGKFEYETLPVNGTEERKIFNSLVNEKFKAWLEADNGVIPLGKGQKFTELTSKTYSSEGTRDIRAMINDIFDFTAKGFNIPPALLRGDIQGTSDAVDQLLTFGIDPLTDMFSEEIIRKRVGRTDYLKGTYLQIDTKAIKHIDLLSVANAIDKIIGSGAYCINDIRKACGDSVIDEPWANQHFMTKNYSTVADLLAALEGGNPSG